MTRRRPPIDDLRVLGGLDRPGRRSRYPVCRTRVGVLVAVALVEERRRTHRLRPGAGRALLIVSSQPCPRRRTRLADLSKFYKACPEPARRHVPVPGGPEALLQGHGRRAGSSSRRNGAESHSQSPARISRALSALKGRERPVTVSTAGFERPQQADRGVRGSPTSRAGRRGSRAISAGELVGSRTGSGSHRKPGRPARSRRRGRPRDRQGGPVGPDDLDAGAAGRDRHPPARGHPEVRRRGPGRPGP